MSSALAHGLIAFAILAGIGAGWRIASNRRSLPCPSWLSRLVELDNPLFRSNAADNIIAVMSLDQGMIVLDAGCGPGRLAIPIARRIAPDGFVVALDIQPGMLEKARRKADRAGIANIRFVRGALGTSAALDAASFDRAVLSAVLGEIPDRRAAIREIVRLLKPDGSLTIAETIADPHFQSFGSVRALAGEFGLREGRLAGGRFAYAIRFDMPSR
jgi:SAM-dependent methyltransferase